MKAGGSKSHNSGQGGAGENILGRERIISRNLMWIFFLPGHHRAVIPMPYHPSGPRNQFDVAIKRVFQQINARHFGNKLSLSKSSLRVMNDLIIDAFQKLLSETQSLLAHQRRRVLTSQSLDEAVKLLVRHHHFATRCQFYGRKAVCDFFHHEDWDDAHEFD